jgi:hypothetical protein
MLFTCSSCGRKQRIPDEFRNKPVQCGVCGRVHRIANPFGASSDQEVLEMVSLPARPSAPPPTPVKPRRPEVLSQINWRALLRGGILESSQVQAVACALVLLSFLDFFMTYFLLQAHPMFYESNPVAHWFYERWNVSGLLAFKFSVVGGAILLSEIIERKRPGWGRLVLWIGCLGTAYAVYKGVILYGE